MKRWSIFMPIILIFFAASCIPSMGETTNQTSTASTAIAASWTKTPTPTLTHTPTFTPTNTPIPTMTPTPLGGGSGQIVCENCFFAPGYHNSISFVKSDGTGEVIWSDKSMHSPVWSQNGTRLAYAATTGLLEPRDQWKNFICVVDASTLKEQCFDEILGPFALSPDGTKLAIITSDKPILYLINVNNGEKRILLEGSEGVYFYSGPVWSPDGATIAFADGGLAVIDIESGEKRTLVEGSEARQFRSLYWSPDGKRILYERRKNIFVVNADGSNSTLIAKNAFGPIWSPDGTRVAYTIGGNSGLYNIIVMNADGTNKVKLTPSQPIYGDRLIWTSDGNFIVYTTYVGSPYNARTDLNAVEVNTQRLISLTETHDVLRYTVSPDGSAIAYTTGSYKAIEKGECFKTFVVNLDGIILSEWKDISCGGIVGPWRP